MLYSLLWGDKRLQLNKKGAQSALLFGGSTALTLVCRLFWIGLFSFAIARLKPVFFSNALFPTWGDKRLQLNKKAHFFEEKM